MIQKHSNKIGAAAVAILLVLGVYWAITNKSGISVPRDSSPTISNDQGTNPFSETDGTSSLVRITDKANLYSVDIPDDWTVLLDQVYGKLGEQSFFSQIHGRSSDWQVDEASTGLDTSVHIETGVVFSFDAYYSAGVCDQAMYEIAISRESIRTDNVVIDGIQGKIKVERESVPPRQVLVLLATAIRSNTCYTFQVIFNPTTYPQGEDVFMGILKSIRFI